MMSMKKGIITESVSTLGQRSRVDRDAGVVRRVRVLGLTSKNGRKYKREAIRKAKALYEGAPLYVDHPTDQRGRLDLSPKRQRKSEEKLGQLSGVIEESDGLYADAHLLTSHPMASRVMEAAEKMPAAFGLSHRIEATTHKDRSGTLIVESIDKVHSVDLVPYAATNTTLFESVYVQPEPRGKQMAKITVKSLFEAMVPHTTPKTGRLIRKSLAEMGELATAAPMDEEYIADEPEAALDEKAPEDHLHDGFTAAIAACLEGEGSNAEKAAKIRALLDHYEKADSLDSTEEEPVPEDVDPEDDVKAESVYVIKQLEAAGKPVTSKLVESLTGLPRGKVKQLVESLTGSGRTSPVKSGGPMVPSWSQQQTQPGQPLAESATSPGDSSPEVATVKRLNESRNGFSRIPLPDQK